MNDKGFTLIELLVVIAIIGLLSTFAVVALNNARVRSRESKRVADINQLHKALELYFADNNQYPPIPGTGCVSATQCNLGEDAAAKMLCGSGWAGSCAGGEKVFMSAVPSAPIPKDGAACTDATNKYRYSVTMAGSPTAAISYTLGFCLGNKTGELDAGERIADPNGIK